MHVSDRCGRATVTLKSSLNTVDAYRRFEFRDAGDDVVDGAGVRIQPMSARFTTACLLNSQSNDGVTRAQ